MAIAKLLTSCLEGLRETARAAEHGFPASADSAETACLRPPYEAWGADLRAMSDRLRGLAGTTEGEYLSVGSILRETHAGAGRISDLSSFVASAMSGEEIDSAIDGLRGMMDRMKGFLSRAEEDTARDESSLRQVHQALGELRGPLKEFKKIVKFLRNLGIATKIESARMGENSGGFGVVAENVENMSILFEAKSEDIAQRSAALDSVIGQTLSRVIEHHRGLRERARAILGDAGANLSALGDTHSSCAAAARTILESSAEVSRNVGEIVTSMQSHDITRQQIEHVTQAIDDLVRKLEAGGAGPETVALAAGVCRLQAAHLANSRATMVKSAETLVANLRGIAVNSIGIARMTTHLSAGPAGQSGQNVLAGVGQSLASVGSSLMESAAAVRETSAVIRSIARTVEEMSSFMDDIREIGEEIELVALNAEIKRPTPGAREPRLASWPSRSSTSPPIPASTGRRFPERWTAYGRPPRKWARPPSSEEGTHRAIRRSRRRRPASTGCSNPSPGSAAASWNPWCGSTKAPASFRKASSGPSGG